MRKQFEHDCDLANFPGVAEAGDGRTSGEAETVRLGFVTVSGLSEKQDHRAHEERQ